MAPSICVLIHSDDDVDNARHIINTIEPYWTPTVNGVPMTAAQMDYKYPPSYCRFFILFPVVRQVRHEELPEYRPDIVVILDMHEAKFKGVDLLETFWSDLEKFFNVIMAGETDDALYERLKPALYPPVVPDLKPLPDHRDFELAADTVSHWYEYREKLVDDRLYFEVIKPNTDRPYTSFVDNFSQRGYLPVVTSLYQCSSWGVAAADNSFIKLVWENKGFTGELDIDNLIKDHVELVQAGTVAEPKVYRETLENVIKNTA